MTGVLESLRDDASVPVADEERMRGEGRTGSEPETTPPAAPIDAPGQVPASARAPAAAGGKGAAAAMA